MNRGPNRSLGSSTLRALLSILLLPLSACSWGAVRPAPRHSSGMIMREPECTESVAAPVVDTVFVTAYASLAILAIASLISGAQQDDQSSCDRNPDPDDWCLDVVPSYSDLAPVIGVFAAVVGGAAITHAFAADYGYSNTAKCREQRDRFRQARPNVERQAADSIAQHE